MESVNGFESHVPDQNIRWRKPRESGRTQEEKARTTVGRVHLL